MYAQSGSGCFFPDLDRRRPSEATGVFLWAGARHGRRDGRERAQQPSTERARSASPVAVRARRPRTARLRPHFPSLRAFLHLTNEGLVVNVRAIKVRGEGGERDAGATARGGEAAAGEA